MKTFRIILFVFGAIFALSSAHGYEWPSPSDNAIEMPIPLMAQGDEGRWTIGEVFTRLDPSTGVPASVDLQELDSMLVTVADALKWTSPSTDGFIALSELALPLDWDEEDAAIVIVMPKGYKRPSKNGAASMFLQYQAPPYEIVDPATYSGYFNLRAKHDIANLAGRSTSNISTVRGELVVNVRNWAFLSDITHTRRDRGAEWAVERTALIREFPLYTVAFGDVAVHARGVQLAPMLSGFHLSKGVSRWNQLSGSSNASVFDVRTPTRLEVIRDGQVIAVHDLAPGQYRYQQYGIFPGDLSTYAILTDEAGAVREIFAGINYSILNPGEWAGALSLGYVRSRGNRVFGRYGAPLTAHYFLEKENDWTNPVLHGFYERGLGNGIDWHAGLQSDTYTAIAATGIRFADPFGMRDLSGSVYGGLLYDWSRGRTAGSVSADMTRRFGEGSSVSGTLSWQGDGFAGSASKSNFSGSLSFSHITGPVQHTLTGAVFKNGEFPVSTALRYGLSWRVTADWRLGASAEWREAANGQDTTTASISIGWNPLGNPSNRYAAYGTVSDQSAQASFSNDRVTRGHYYGASLSGQRMDSGDWSSEINGYYYNNRFTASAAQRFSDGDKGISKATSLTFGSAVAFAGGQWSISKPITDSFVIIRTHPAWLAQGVSATANPDFWGGNQGESSWLPTVLPLSAHPDGSSFQIGIKGGESSMLSLDQSNYKAGLLPYQGALLVVGSDAALMIQGTIFRPDGEPLRRTRIRLEGPNGEVLSSFTSTSGRFAEGPLSPGVWRLSAFNGRFSAEITVRTEDLDEGIVFLGRITMAEAAVAAKPVYRTPAPHPSEMRPADGPIAHLAESALQARLQRFRAAMADYGATSQLTSQIQFPTPRD